jgi:hypothetical protein
LEHDRSKFEVFGLAKVVKNDLQGFPQKKLKSKNNMKKSKFSPKKNEATGACKPAERV